MPVSSKTKKSCGNVLWKLRGYRASLVAQWLGIRLPVGGTGVRSLVRRHPTCCGATKLVHQQLLSLCSRALEPQLRKPMRLEPVLCNKRSHRNEQPAHRNEEQPPLAPTKESPRAATKTQCSQK